MPLHEQTAVRIDGATIVWDGVKQPETLDDGGKKYTLKVVVPANSPDLPILDQIAQQALRESEFKGNLPPGAHWIMRQVEANEFGGLFPGWYCVNGITYQPPQVFDEQGNTLQAMQYGPQIFNGQRVNILVTAKAYNNKSKGVKAQLEAFQIVASAGAQPIAIGGPSVNAASAFGGGAPQQAPAQQGYGAPQQAPAQQAPAQQAPAQQAPAQQAYGAPQQAPAQQGYGAPQQAHNFLPQR